MRHFVALPVVAILTLSLCMAASPGPTRAAKPSPTPVAKVTARSCTRAASPFPHIYAGPRGVHTVLGLSGLYSNVAAAQLVRFAKYHVNGFLLDHVYGGTHDDFLNGGVGRLPPADCRAFASSTRKIVRSAAARGMTDIFLRIIAQVLVRSNPPDSRYKFDVFNTGQLDNLKQTFHNEAVFARNVGMKGIWIDAEPYNYTYYWRQNQDPAMPAHDQPESAVKAQYFRAGAIAERAMLKAYPHIQVLLSPAFGYGSYMGNGPDNAYEYYSDFYAGMVSVAAQKGGQGFTLATEAGYGISTPSLFRGIYNYEEGLDKIGVHNGVVIYTAIKDVLQAYDAAHGTHLWAWHLKHSTVALPTWPYKADGTFRFPLDTWQQIVTAERAVSPKYTWIYDQNGQWFQPRYTCTWRGKTTTGNLACPGLVLRDTLPKLRKPTH